jgi:hypothetical protein
MYKRSLIWKRSLLGQKHPTFCCVQTHKPFMFIGTNRVLAHWSNSSRIDTSLHSKTLSLFRANQFLLLLLNVVCFTLTPECCVLYSYSWMLCALLLLLNAVCFTLTSECCVLYSYSWMLCALLLLLNDVCFTLTPEWCVLYSYSWMLCAL